MSRPRLPLFVTAIASILMPWDTGLTCGVVLASVVGSGWVGLRTIAHSQQEWQATQRSRRFWLGASGFGILIPVIGLVVYLSFGQVEHDLQEGRRRSRRLRRRPRATAPTWPMPAGDGWASATNAPTASRFRTCGLAGRRCALRSGERSILRTRQETSHPHHLRHLRLSDGTYRVPSRSRHSPDRDG